ncbi:TetR/AcrR family transcriptional regulator [Streptomyces poriferorum]|uniref:TetR/AcrR family transcriptional regulator n=1 Tax=Streptomyces poriferorum TaxID=2798799 RepID=A0ABY9IPZ9_9ACTN|nr:MULTISPECIES: TetR/AcrR family transcriptional regulator [Streptomyces]MBW5251304.1 TetR/AcrR family transcriptional regulator [Streptomyces poriferorum]MBW5257393.1 TetR/AcrR family transcriptional regulator [Streptomyces poriferorum]MDP5313611.1 TetR/AcrR family transcriptional regulator [Streptomyces sp. Alt4]WLQ49888.1 TetR/AcrR family transcriptional regulator [Streptomyces sp. Alt1]WLQ57423.1 TetR/AcrR family transcriptional regulator [Streptomyces sp. Alt2]
MAGRRRWSTEEILDAAVELLRSGSTESFSVRKLAATLGTDSSSLYRHFRSKTELLRAVADRILLDAMEDHLPEGDWRQRITSLALRVREAFGRQPQLAAVWGRYASGGTGSRLVVEEVLQALRASGLPDEEIPVRYHRLAVLIAALVTSEAGVSTITSQEYEQGMELFRVSVLGADPERFPALAHFARDVRPLGADRGAAFEELLAAQLDQIEGVVRSA